MMLSTVAPPRGESARMPSMRAGSFGAFLLIGLLAGCGGQSPSAPSVLTPSTLANPGASTAQSLVASAVNQAAMNTATLPPFALSRTTTSSCADGGTMSITFDGGGGTSGPFTSSSRLEFTDCRNQGVTMNGEPAILLDSTVTLTRPTGTGPTSVSVTSHMSGGVRFDAPGSTGRARYDCTMTLSVQVASDGTPSQQTFAYSGTMTWEQPLGTVTVRACGT